MTVGWAQTSVGAECIVRPPKREAKARLALEDLVTFLPMDQLGIRSKDFEPGPERPLGDVYKNYTYFADGDLLLAKITPCFENGKLGIASGLKNGVGFGSSEYIVLRCKERILPEFLFYFLCQDELIDGGVAAMTGAVGHRRVPPEFVQELPIQLPPIPVQRRIAETLEAGFSAIESIADRAELNLANAQELFDSSMRSMLASSSGATVERTVGELLEAGWLIDHMDGNHGSLYPRKNEFVESGVPYISANALQDGQLDMTKAKYLSPERAGRLRKGFSRSGDVLFAHNATVGPVAILKTVEPLVVLGTSLTYYRCNAEMLSSRYLAHFLRSSPFVRQYEQVMRQSTRNQVPITTQRRFSISIPSMEDQRRISAALDRRTSQVRELRRVYTDRLSELESLRQALLKSAFRGRLTESMQAETLVAEKFNG